MQDTLIIFYDGGVLITLTNFKNVTPNKIEILDWYSKVYGFERNKLKAVWSQSICMKNMTYEDYEKGMEVTCDEN